MLVGILVHNKFSYIIPLKLHIHMFQLYFPKLHSIRNATDDFFLGQTIQIKGDLPPYVEETKEFQLICTGPSQVSLQWFRNGVDISSEQDSNFIIQSQVFFPPITAFMRYFIYYFIIFSKARDKILHRYQSVTIWCMVFVCMSIGWSNMYGEARL